MFAEFIRTKVTLIHTGEANIKRVKIEVKDNTLSKTYTSIYVYKNIMKHKLGQFLFFETIMF